MSEDLTKHGHNSPLEFEPQDLSPTAVYFFLVGLAVAGILVALMLWGLYRVMDSYESVHQPPQNPIARPGEANTREVTPQEIEQFPQPRLETNERLEINAFRLQEEQKLNSYGWVDQQAGVARIPIDRAMEIIAERGLPTTPKAGAVPASAVNVVNQAAQKADTSNQPQAKKAAKH